MKAENLFRWQIEERERKKCLNIILSFLIVAGFILAVMAIFYLSTKVNH